MKSSAPLLLLSSVFFVLGQLQTTNAFSLVTTKRSSDVSHKRALLLHTATTTPLWFSSTDGDDNEDDNIVETTTTAFSGGTTTSRRRSVLGGLLLLLTTTTTTTTTTTAAYAEVSAGTSLPDGAAQFSRLIGTKNDLVAVSKRVRTAEPAEIDKKEWESISVFLRKVYSSGEDMKFISNTMSDNAKKARTQQIVKLIQKLSVAGDLPAQKGDPAAYLVVSDKLEVLVEEFFDLLRDVPDEI